MKRSQRRPDDGDRGRRRSSGPRSALEKYSALVWPNGWSSSAGRAAIVTIASANSAEARLTNDSIASDSRPTEPVIHQAAVFMTIVSDRHRDGQAQQRRDLHRPSASAQGDAGELALADLDDEGAGRRASRPRSETTAPSMRTPPPSIRRIASLVDGASRACLSKRADAERRAVEASPRRSRRECRRAARRSKSAAPASAAAAPWKRAVISLASSTLASRGLRPAAVSRAARRSRPRTAIAQQIEVLPHQLVADRHQFGEHVVGGVGDGDVVALRLRHLLDAVEAFEQRHRHDALRLLAVLGLQRAADEQVEFLVGAAELEVATSAPPSRSPASADRGTRAR